MFFGLPLVTFNGNLGYSLAKTRGKRERQMEPYWHDYTQMYEYIHACKQSIHSDLGVSNQAKNRRLGGWGIDDGAAALDRQQKWQRSHLLL